MKKVEVFKASNGELFEDERKYILAESALQRKSILDQWEKLSKVIKSKPELYYEFILNIGRQIVENKNSIKDIEKQYDDVMSIFSKEKRIQLDDYNRSGESVEMEPYIWGNDILPGYDVNR